MRIVLHKITNRYLLASVLLMLIGLSSNARNRIPASLPEKSFLSVPEIVKHQNELSATSLAGSLVFTESGSNGNNGNGDNGSSSSPVIIFSTTNLAFGNICNGSVISFTLSGTGLSNKPVQLKGLQSGNITMSTEPNGPFSSALNFSPTTGVVAATTVYVKYTGNSISNEDVITAKIASDDYATFKGSATVYALPTISTQPSNAGQTPCLNASATALSITASAGSGSLASVAWYSNTTNTNTGGTLVSTIVASGSSATKTYTPLTSATGTLYYYAVVTNSNGCKTTSNVSGAITVSGSPAPTASNSGPVCSGSALNLSTVSVASATYSWVGPNGFSSSLRTPSIPAATTAASGTYSLTVTVNGCTSLAGTTIATVNAIPATPSASNDGPGCPGTTLNLSTASITGATYAWVGPNGFISSLRTPSIPAATTAASGTYSVTVTVNGCTSASGTTTASIGDLIKPIITAPADIAVNTNTNCTATGVVLGTPVTADNCSVASVTNNHESSTYPLGETIVTWTVTDGSGNTATATQKVTVSDKTAPVVPTLSDVTGECSATATAPTTTDNCVGTVTGTTSDPLTYNAQGTYTITWTFNDGNGNTSTATQKVIVKDVTAPVVPTLSDVTGECSATATAPTTTDNCAGTVTGTTSDPLTYNAQGTYTITWTFNDGNGNTSTATQKVIVKDVTAPVVPTLSDVTGECSATATAPTTTDNCAGTVTGTTSDPLTYKAQGTYTITWTFNDGNGNSSTATQKVIVKDVTAPVVPTLSDVTGECSATATAPTTTDNCAGTVTGTTSDPLTYNAQGTYTINWTFNDGNGNTSTATQKVVVKDVTPPVLTVASGSTANVFIQYCGGTVPTAATVTAIDACSGAATVSFTEVRANGVAGTNAKYTLTRTWTATDANGNTSKITQVITVGDNIAPVPMVANLPVLTGQCSVKINTTKSDDDDNDEEDNKAGACQAYGSAPLATDNCARLVKATTVDPLVYTTQGTYYIHWVYNDGNGNTTTQIQTVIVNDVTAPKPKEKTLPIITGQCSVTIGSTVANYDNDGDDDHKSGIPTAKDNCAGLIIGTTTDPLTYNTQGTYTIHWRYDDGHGNVTTQNQTVIVKDVTAPKPVVSNLPAITGQCSAAVTTAPTANDNCSGVITGTTTSPLSYSAQGTYNITWTYTDAAGNTSTQVQKVIVKDNTAPVITVPANVTVSCSASTAPAANGTATATDNCSSVVITFSDVTKGNVINRTWKATDASGNSSTGTQLITFGTPFTVTLSSTPTSSTFTGAGANNLFLGYGAQSTTLKTSSLPTEGSNYTYIWSGANAAQLSSTTAAAPVFTPTASGSYTFTVVVTNKYGCTASSSITICVTDVRAAGGLVYVYHFPKTGAPQQLTLTAAQVAQHLTGDCKSDRLGTATIQACNTVNYNSSSLVNSGNTIPIKTETATAVEDGLNVVVMPNPSSTYFTLKLQSNDPSMISLRVMDAAGRTIDAKSQLNPNSTIQIGKNYNNGTYYAEMTQGAKRKVVQLVKIK